MKTRGVFYFGKFIVLGIVFLALFTYVVMLLWNWLVPDLFTGPVLNYWQTLGILLLSKILLSGLGYHHKERSNWKSESCKEDHSRTYWKKKFQEKMRSKLTGVESEENQSGDRVEV